MSASTDRILAAIDAGMQTSPESDVYVDVAPAILDVCVRCQRRDRDGDSDWCEPCRAFLLGDAPDPTCAGRYAVMAEQGSGPRRVTARDPAGAWVPLEGVDGAFLASAVNDFQMFREEFSLPVERDEIGFVVIHLGRGSASLVGRMAESLAPLVPVLEQAQHSLAEMLAGFTSLLSIDDPPVDEALPVLSGVRRRLAPLALAPIADPLPLALVEEADLRRHLEAKASEVVVSVEVRIPEPPESAWWRGPAWVIDRGMR